MNTKIFINAILFVISPTLSESFSISHQRQINKLGIEPSTTTTSTALHQSQSTDDDGKRKSRIGNEKFLEESSQSGYDKVKQMSIEERTKRAMLAEAAEDRIVMLSEELDKLLGDDGMPLTVEDREEVTILATQIKASREQYKALVNGGESQSLGMFDSDSSSTSNIDDNGIDLQ